MDEAQIERLRAEPHPAPRRIVVVSPHLDDAVLSLGATISSYVHAGDAVEILTVFSSAPDSNAPAGPWDHKSGFLTEAQAARSRRDEDDRACRILGATPRRLDFGAEPYPRRGTDEEIRSAVMEIVAGAACALIPGFPLAHRDHAELTAMLLQADIPCPLGLYAEQPYVFYERKTLLPSMVVPALKPWLASAPEWKRRPAARNERRVKIKAIRSYSSQLPQLGLSHIGLYRMLWHEAALGGEAIAWLGPRGRR